MAPTAKPPESATPLADGTLQEPDGEALQRKNRRPRAINDMKGGDGLAGADSTTLFLADLKKHGVPLLSGEQEVDLARKVRAGDERALERFISANLRLCVHVAKRFKSRGQRKGVALSDLVSAGVIGLQAAIRRFDPDRGVRLARFADSYIQGAMRDELKKARIIRLPREVLSLTQKIITAKERLRVTDYTHTPQGQRVWRGSEPTIEEIAARLGLSPKTVLETLLHPTQHSQPGYGSPAMATEVGLGKSRFDENAAEAWDVGGTNHNYRADVEGTAFGAGAAPPAEHPLETNETHARLYKALEALTKQEREVLSRYFDFGDNPDIDRPNAHGGESLTQIARTMGISKQRASAVKQQVLIKLRNALGKRVR
jgi:RNA polymerase sigma factor (sigma-70 family)